VTMVSAQARCSSRSARLIGLPHQRLCCPIQS